MVETVETPKKLTTTIPIMAETVAMVETVAPVMLAAMAAMVATAVIHMATRIAREAGGILHALVIVFIDMVLPAMQVMQVMAEMQYLRLITSL